MDIVERFEALVRDAKWEDARLVAHEILDAAPHISTSWFNLAVCQEALRNFAEAERCFREAYDREPEDKGIQYRIFRCLALSGDVRAFTRFAEAECAELPEVYSLLVEGSEFSEMVNSKWFKFRFRGRADA